MWFDNTLIRSGLYSQSYLHPPKISLLPPPEVTRIRCLVNQDKKPTRPLQHKPSFLQKLRGKDGGKKEEPLRNADLIFNRQYINCTLFYCFIKNFVYWLFNICCHRKLPLPEIFYNNNELDMIDNLSDSEDGPPENQDAHER